MNPHGHRFCALATLALVLAAGAPVALAAVGDSNEITGALVPPSANDSLRAFLILQEQIRATQQALEQNRQETAAFAARSSDAVAQQLKALTETMNAQRAREIEAVQSTNRLLLVVVGVFASLGFAAMLMTAWLQMRAVQRLTEFSTLMPARMGMAGMEGTGLISNAATAQANAQLFGALDRIERRMKLLEESGPPTAAAVSPDPVAPVAGENGAPSPSPSQAERAAPARKDDNQQISLLLAKGQSLLSLDQAAEALVCFDEVLWLDPDHAEALVKKGTALEMLRRDEDALQCYNRAIAADDTLTIAYLQKGGLFNRMERYDEALACYERALQTQERS